LNPPLHYSPLYSPHLALLLSFLPCLSSLIFPLLIYTAFLYCRYYKLPGIFETNQSINSNPQIRHLYYFLYFMYYKPPYISGINQSINLNSQIRHMPLFHRQS
jgi:hypothetical protein